MADTADVAYERRGNTARITINRPQAKNSLGPSNMIAWSRYDKNYAMTEKLG